MIKTVVFDIGNVLMRFNWMNWAKEAYGEETRDVLAKTFWGKSYWDELDRGTWKVVHFLAKCLEDAPEYEKEIRDAMARVGECMLKCDYAIPWVKELKEQGYQVLFLSNYSYYLRRCKPEVLDFIPYMDGGVFSCDVKMIKPDAGIYARLCAEYGLEPSECLFIDDTRKNVEAAKAYGMHAIHFESYEQAYADVAQVLRRSRAGRPLIGVLPLWDDERESMWMLPGYFEGIMEAGGLPVMLPMTEDPEMLDRLADMCDGFLFTGGHDVSPEVYCKPVRVDNVVSCPARDRMEEPLLERLLNLDKPVLGICRGLQFINGALGGDLYQDLPTQHPSDICHRQTPPYDVPVHEVKILKGTPLYELLGEDRIEVNSRHHQAVMELSHCLRMMAESPDGLCEAAWMPGQKFLWAVQWHPEHSFEKDENSRKILRALVEACEL